VRIPAIYLALLCATTTTTPSVAADPSVPTASATNWVIRATDTYMSMEKPKGDDFSELVEALLYVGEKGRVRELCRRQGEHIDRVFDDPEHFAPIQANAFLSVAHGWAALGDRAEFDRTLAKADAAAAEADESTSHLFLWHKARATARIDLNRAVEIVKGLEDSRRADGFVDLAFILANVRDREGVSRTLGLARNAAKDLPKAHETTRIAADAVDVWLHAGDADTALAAADGVEDAGRRMMAYDRVARVLRRSGQSDRAAAVLQKIRAIAEGADAKAAASFALNYAIAAAEQGRGPEALEAVRRAERELANVKGQGRFVEGQAALTQAYAWVGDMESSRRLLRRVREVMGPEREPLENPFEQPADDEGVPPEDRLPPRTIIDSDLEFTAAAFASRGHFEEAVALVDTLGRHQKDTGLMWVARGATVHGDIGKARQALRRVKSEVTQQVGARVIAEVLAGKKAIQELDDWVASQPVGRARLWAELGAAEGMIGRRFSDPVIR